MAGPVSNGLGAEKRPRSSWQCRRGGAAGGGDGQRLELGHFVVGTRSADLSSVSGEPVEELRIGSVLRGPALAQWPEAWTGPPGQSARRGMESLGVLTVEVDSGVAARLSEMPSRVPCEHRWGSARRSIHLMSAQSGSATQYQRRGVGAQEDPWSRSMPVRPLSPGGVTPRCRETRHWRVTGPQPSPARISAWVSAPGCRAGYRRRRRPQLQPHRIASQRICAHGSSAVGCSSSHLRTHGQRAGFDSCLRLRLCGDGCDPWLQRGTRRGIPWAESR